MLLSLWVFFFFSIFFFPPGLLLVSHSFMAASLPPLCHSCPSWISFEKYIPSLPNTHYPCFVLLYNMSYYLAYFTFNVLIFYLFPLDYKLSKEGIFHSFVLCFIWISLSESRYFRTHLVGRKGQLWEPSERWIHSSGAPQELRCCTEEPDHCQTAAGQRGNHRTTHHLSFFSSPFFCWYISLTKFNEKPKDQKLIWFILCKMVSKDVDQSRQGWRVIPVVQMGCTPMVRQ